MPLKLLIGLIILIG